MVSMSHHDHIGPTRLVQPMCFSGHTCTTAPYPAEKHFGLISHALVTTTFRKREFKRMGKRI